jgi:hypothetical protein
MRRAERQRDQDRKADDAFLDVWREWRAGRTLEACEVKIAWMLANRSPICAGVARRDIDRRRGLNAQSSR